MIKSTNNGGFLSLMGDRAYKALDKIADNTQQWDFSSCRDKSAQITEKGGIYELSEEAEMKLKIDVLTKRPDTLDVSRPISAANALTVESCSICASSMHQAHNCPSMVVFSEMEQVNVFNDFRKQSSGPYSESYNPG
jgi:hypothetical protein